VKRYTTRSLIPTGIYRKGGDCWIGLVIPDPLRLGDTGAAILQKACELNSSITENLLRPVAILVKWIASSVQLLLCVFKKSKFLQTSTPALSTQLLLNLWQFSMLRSNEYDFNCQMHCGWF